MSRLTAPVQLSTRLFILYSEFPHIDSGNVYLITGKSPTLIDCGSQRAVPQIIENLVQIGLQVTDLAQVIATHGDYDHIQGYHELRRLHPQLQLHIHRQDWPVVQGSDTYRNASYLYRRPFVPLLAEQCLPLDDGQTIAAGDTTLTIIHTPGHSEGSVCLLGEIDGHRVLFAGDVVGGSMRSLKGATMETWVAAFAAWEQSLQHLATFDFEWVLNGHEPVKTLPIRRAQFDRMLTRFGQMLNPWFLLGEEEPVAEPEEHAALLSAGK